MSSLMSIPIGFRFNPTDEELLRCFLYSKIMGDPLPWDGITDRIVYGADAEPWKVFSDADADDGSGSPYYWQTKVEGGYVKKTIYVFTKITPNNSNNKSKSKKNNSNNSSNSTRASRIAGCGTWFGQTGQKDIKRSDTGDTIGHWRIFTFRCKTKKDSAKYNDDSVGHWIMHEYSLTDAPGLTNSTDLDLVLCKITKWIKIKKNNNEAEAETEAMALPITGNHHVVNNNNKRLLVGKELEKQAGNCKKQQTTSTSSFTADLDQLQAWDMLQPLLDFQNSDIHIQDLID